MPPKSDSSKSNGLENKLAARVELERLVADVSLSFHVADEGALDKSINEALEAIGKFVGADRSTLFQINYDKEVVTYEHEWVDTGIDSQLEVFDEIPFDAFPWMFKQLEEKEIIEISDPNQLPDEVAATRAVLKDQGVRSVLQVSITDRMSRPIGMLSFDAVRNHRDWREEDRYLLRVVGRALGTAIEKVELIKALSRSERTQRRVLDALPDLIFVIDEDGKILDMSVPPDRELVIPADQMIGTLCWSFLRPGSHPKIEQAMSEAFDTGASEPFEDWVIVLSGNLAHYEGRIVRLTDQQLLVIIRDISARKKSQEAIQRLSSQLTLAEENQRRKLAYRLHDGVSQDLAAASLRLQASIAGRGDDEVTHLREIDGLIQRAIRHTTDLTRSLSPPILYELGLIPALTSLSSELMESSGFDIVLTDDISGLQVDEVLSIHLYRIVRELMLNSIKHSGGEKIQVEIEVDSEAAKVLVSDDGKGMDPKVLELDDRNPARGFGLFSIRQRIEPMGGSLEIQSQKGAMVRVRIPLEPELPEAVL